jgi:hypothetical protein
VTPLGFGTQRPREPLAAHVSHSPVQLLSQHTPAAQKFDSQSLGAEQVAPFVPPVVAATHSFTLPAGRHENPSAQSASVLHRKRVVDGSKMPQVQPAPRPTSSAALKSAFREDDMPRL